MRSVTRFIVRLIPWLGAALCVFGWLVLRFPPSGVFVREVAFDGRSPWLNSFLPGQRASAPGGEPGGWVGQRITGEPVYASARVPGSYDTLDLDLEIRPTLQPLIELGLTAQDGENFEMVPVWSEALSKGFRRVATGTSQGYVREGLADQILLTAPAESKMVWRDDTPSRALMDTRPETRTYTFSLRGSHDFYFIPVNGVIDVKFSLQDVNRNRKANANAIGFRLTRDNEVLWTDAIGMSGSRDVRPTKVYEKAIRITNLTGGVYHLALSADDDIFIRGLTTTAQHWVIGPRLYFGDVNGFAATVTPGRAWTTSQHLLLQTVHQEGLQDVRLGSGIAHVTQTHTTYKLARVETERATDLFVEAAKADMRIIGDGYFAFDRDRLFYPSPRRLTDASEPLAEGINAIVTPYEPPVPLEDGWQRVHASFPLHVEAGQSVRFVLGAPGIETRGGTVDVRAATLTYRRAALTWQDWFTLLRRELRAAWHRL